VTHVVVIGAGGNIGSHLVPHLARAADVSRVTLVDRGHYELDNLRTQDIDPRDVGRKKAEVQARRLRRLNPALAVTALPAAVEDVPLGALRGEVILACLDSRRARLVVNQAAWRLGVKWVNAGVAGRDLLVRIQTFVPSPDAACLECAWDQGDYDAVEQNYPCHVDGSAAPTNAPSSLGALAASLQVIECAKLLAGDSDQALVGRDLMMDARHHRQFVTTFRRNPACRMPDHDSWHIGKLDAPASRLKLRALLVVGDADGSTGDELMFGVAGQRIALTLTCQRCGAARRTFRLERALRRGPACRHCGTRLQASGFDLRDAAPLSAVPRRSLDVPLSRLGVRPGDVISLTTPSADRRYEIGGDHE
jgi:molybdopterin/thiamine biosynthesis adenylyltransferase